MISLIFDTETTGLPLPSVADLIGQPRIIDLAVVRVEDGIIISESEWLINPEYPLPEIITKITGLKDEDLVGQPKFHQLLAEIEEAFGGADQLIAHNAPFDVFLLQSELNRCARTGFPWPKTITCTVQEFHFIKGRRLRMTELYELKMFKPLDQKHRALSDAQALAEICIKEGLA